MWYSRKQNDYDEKNTSTMKYISILLKKYFCSWLYICIEICTLASTRRKTQETYSLCCKKYVCVCMYVHEYLEYALVCMHTYEWSYIVSDCMKIYNDACTVRNSSNHSMNCTQRYTHTFIHFKKNMTVFLDEYIYVCMYVFVISTRFPWK